MKALKRILIVLLIAFIVIQFIRPARNTQEGLLANDITHVKTVPDTVLHLLQRSCYDCHSNNTVYPWYMNIQPSAWYLANHINEGKHELNFSEFGSYTPAKQLKKLQKLGREVKEGGMPLSSYTLIHRYASLNEGEKQLIINWTDSLAAKY